MNLFIGCCVFYGVDSTAGQRVSLTITGPGPSFLSFFFLFFFFLFSFFLVATKRLYNSQYVWQGRGYRWPLLALGLFFFLSFSFFSFFFFLFFFFFFFFFLFFPLGARGPLGRGALGHCPMCPMVNPAQPTACGEHQTPVAKLVWRQKIDYMTFLYDWGNLGIQQHHFFIELYYSVCWS